MVIDRPFARARIHEAFTVHPAVTLIGPRQCGKISLAREVAAADPQGSTFFDLESAVDRRQLQAPEQALAGLSGLVVIDEIQREPALFETLRVLADRPGNPARFLVLGSASLALVRVSRNPSPAEWVWSSSRGSICRKSDRNPGAPSGSEAASRAHTLPPKTAPPRCGGGASCRRSSNATSRGRAWMLISPRNPTALGQPRRRYI